MLTGPCLAVSRLSGHLRMGTTTVTLDLHAVLSVVWQVKWLGNRLSDAFEAETRLTVTHFLRPLCL